MTCVPDMPPEKATVVVDGFTEARDNLSQVKSPTINVPSEKAKIVMEDLAKVRNVLLKEKNPTPQMRRDVSNKFFIAHSGNKESVKSIEDFTIPTPDNGKVGFRKYVPNVQKGDFIAVHIHGGGWTQGNLETHDYFCRKIVNSWGVEVYAVDYRLAPEYPYPTPLNDAFLAYKWVAEKFPDKKIVIIGESGGGNLCAALSIRIAEEKYRAPVAQVLIYPALSSDMESGSFKTYGNLSALTAVATKDYTSQYAGAGKKYNDPDVVSNAYIYPLAQKDFKVFPKTILIPAECDVLLDGQLEFKKKLEEVKTPVSIIYTKGTVHGFTIYGKEFDEEVTYVLKEAENILKTF